MLIDEGDFVGVGELLAHATITADGMGELSGGDAIQRLYESTTRRYPDGTPLTQHVITNPIVEVSADQSSARVRSRYTVFQATPALGLQAIIGGAYDDGFERVDGVWRFSSRRMGVSLIGELREHLLFDPATLSPD